MRAMGLGGRRDWTKMETVVVRVAGMMIRHRGRVGGGRRDRRGDGFWLIEESLAS